MTLPQLRIMAMEATIFTGWIHDHLLPHAENLTVAHPLITAGDRCGEEEERLNSRPIAVKSSLCGQYLTRDLRRTPRGKLFQSATNISAW
jgi:hypothetical protein